MNNYPKTRNISYQVFLRTRKTQGLLEEKLKNSQGSNIVYCSDYETVNLTTGYLRSSGIPAVALHEGLDDDHKRASKATFMSKDKITLVTTVYSGGYIYRPETSMIIHCNLPRSIERYRKETKLDRIDNNISECILYFSLEDHRKIKKSISQSKYSSDGRSLGYQELEKIVSYVLSDRCRLSILMNQENLKCGQCDNCSSSDYVDWTIDAQKFLSCIARLEQINQDDYGFGYIIDILRAKKTNKRIVEKAHYDLSTYSIGQDKSEEDWKILAQYLIFHGLVGQTESDKFPILKLNENSWDIMRGQTKVEIPRSTWIPKNRHPITDTSRVLELHKQGVSISDIAIDQGVKETTILTKLAGLILKGESIDFDRIIDKDSQLKIQSAIVEIGNETGTSGLEPEQAREIYDHLKREYYYGMIHLVAAQIKMHGEIIEIDTFDYSYPFDSSYLYELDDDYYPEANSNQFSYGDNYFLDLGYLEDVINPNAY